MSFAAPERIAKKKSAGGSRTPRILDISGCSSAGKQLRRAAPTLRWGAIVRDPRVFLFDEPSNSAKLRADAYRDRGCTRRRTTTVTSRTSGRGHDAPFASSS
jgi:hypothetical protein